MKTRAGFVSNSSSTSFVVVVDSKCQIDWNCIEKSFRKKPHLQTLFKNKKVTPEAYTKTISNLVEALKKGAHLNERLDDFDAELIVSFPDVHVLSSIPVGPEEGSVNPVHPTTIKEIAECLR